MPGSCSFLLKCFLMKAVFRKIMDSVIPYSLLLLPSAIVAGIIDWRFHNYFWPSWNRFRPHTNAMFDFFSVLTLFILVIFLVHVFLTLRKKPERKFGWYKWPIIFTGFGCLVAIIAYKANIPEIRTPYWDIYVNFINPIIVFLLIISYLKEAKWRELFTKSTLLTFSIFGAFCIFEYFTNLLPGINKDFLGRLVWPYINPFVNMKAESANWLAYIFGPTAILAFVRLGRNLKEKIALKESWLEIVAFIIGSSVLLLTKSYTGIGIAVLLITYWFIRNLHGRQRTAFVLALIIAASIGIASQYKTRKFQILLGNYKKENSIERRFQIYKFNAESFIAKPFTGIGPGNYQSYFRANMSNYGINIPEEELPPHPHNLIMNFWAELSIFGLIAALILYIVPMTKIILHPAQNDIFFVFVYFLGHGLIDLPYGLEEFSVLFWMVLALTAISSNKFAKDS